MPCPYKVSRIDKNSRLYLLFEYLLIYSVLCTVFVGTLFYLSKCFLNNEDIGSWTCLRMVL